MTRLITFLINQEIFQILLVSIILKVTDKYNKLQIDEFVN